MSDDNGRYLERYDTYFIPTMMRAYKYFRRWDEGLWRVLELAALSNIIMRKESQLILDLGCGNGDLFETVFGKDVKAFGIDTSAVNVSEAIASGRYVSVTKEDACNMSFPDSSFDLVFSNSVLEHIDEIDSVISEVSRILIPGGMFVFTTPTPLLYSRNFYYWRNRLSFLGLDWIGRCMAKREETIYHHVSILPYAEWEQKLINSGFIKVSKYDYIPKKSALVISKYSGISRYNCWLRIVRHFDKLIYNSTQNWSSEKWVDWYKKALKPYFKECANGEEGCGQVIIAHKK